MKDLKHLIWFEELLQQAHNELVEQATAQGQVALGYNCYYIPEVLLNLPGCFSSRLRAPNSTTADVASYYMTNRNCPYVRCILERAIEGGYNYLGALFGAEGCAAMERMEEHFFLLKPVENERFFVTIIDPPMKGDNTSLDYYKAQLREKVLDKLHQIYGIDTSEKALRGAIEKHNDLCRTVTAIGDFRRLDNPPITGYEFHVIQLVSQVCPHDLILPYLKETLEELKTRQPEPKFPFRARVVLAGSENDDPDFTKLIESCGALVVADRYTTSNAVHQASKLPDGEREKFLDWLFGFEYGLLGLPEPSLVFYLDVPTELTEKMMREREQATNTKADIHEQDEAYLRACRENAKKVAERCSWQRIGCSKDGVMRTVEDIHEEIYRRVMELLKA